MKTLCARFPLAPHVVACYATIMLAEILVPHFPHALYGLLAVAPLLLLRQKAQAQ